MQIGSSARLPLVATMGRRSSRISSTCSGVYGSITPSCPQPGATDGAMLRRASGRASTSTIGASGDSNSCASSSSTRAWCRTHSRSAHNSANGFSSRCFRSRSRRTAPSLAASTSSWNPPSPFIATMRPARMADAAAMSAWSPVASVAPSTSHKASCGPHAGHALGSAWKRRLLGSSYSRWHSGHILKPRIDVLARS